MRMNITYFHAIFFYFILLLSICLLICRGDEASCNPPKLRRNASSTSNISGLTSQSNPTNPGFLKSLCKKIDVDY